MMSGYIIISRTINFYYPSSQFVEQNFFFVPFMCVIILIICLPQPAFDFPKYNPSCLLYKKRLKLKGGGLSRTTFTNDDESILAGPEFFIFINS